jgi:O-succinylhomoserine sulfhydrylase
VFLKGLETLELRMRAHSAAALQLARWLEVQPGVSKVYYAGLESHPQHELAKRQQSGFGGIIAFDVEHGRKGAWAFVDATRLLSITANLGDTKSTINEGIVSRIVRGSAAAVRVPALPRFQRV